MPAPRVAETTGDSDGKAFPRAHIQELEAKNLPSSKKNVKFVAKLLEAIFLTFAKKEKIAILGLQTMTTRELATPSE